MRRVLTIHVRDEQPLSGAVDWLNGDGEVVEIAVASPTPEMNAHDFLAALLTMERRQRTLPFEEPPF